VASSNCVLCPELCSVAVGTNEFGFSINNQKENGGSSVPICVVGRYDNVKQLGGKRITQPMVRQKGGLVPVSMDEAVQVATAAFKRATDAGASVVVSGGGTLSIEEGQLLATLGRDGLHASVGSLESAGAESGLASCAVGQLKNTASDDALEKAEWIIWTGTCPDRDDTVLMARIRRLMRGGAQVLAISSAACEITHNATHWIDVRRGSEAEFLASLVTDDTDSINALAAACHVDVARLESVKAMLQGQGPVVGILADPTDPDVGTLYAALGGLVSALRSSCDKSGVLVMRSITNGSGLEQAGLLAQQGQRPDDIQHAASATPLAGVWLVRDQSPEALKAARRAAFLVVQDVVECDLLERADVVLPASTQFETGGTYVAWDGRSVVIAPALPPVGPSTLDVLSAAAKALK
jgi:predicted molibdopterin-dependent oxidoreductase YjgC